MSDDQLSVPKYRQWEVMAVTRLKPTVLQTWVNRGAIELSEHNPGSGRARLYSAVDVVKLAIMRRTSDLCIDLSKGKQIAEAATEELTDSGVVDWNEIIYLRASDLSPSQGYRPPSSLEHSPDPFATPLERCGSYMMDPARQRVSDLVEPDPKVFPRRRREREMSRRRSSGDIPPEPINEKLRQKHAEQGYHAEPVIIFPVGEIVNGALLQLRAVDAGTHKWLQMMEHASNRRKRASSSGRPG